MIPEEEKYTGLQWYLPPYFKNYLSSGRFEKGVIIYKDKPTGKTWGENIPHIDYLIQIQYPPSTMPSGSGDGNEIMKNWETTVILDLYHPNTKETKVITTTQGKLFTFLWKDNPEVLHQKEVPPVPVFITNKAINEQFITDNIPCSSVGFAFIYNPINDIHLSKLREIKSLFCNVEELTFSAEKACKTEKTGEIYPLLTVKLLIFKNTNYDDVHELIKKAVYKKSKSSEKDMFRIATHGLLIQR